MKRSKHLEPLSHDHYEGLLVAGRLQKGFSVYSGEVGRPIQTDLGRPFQAKQHWRELAIKVAAFIQVAVVPPQRIALQMKPVGVVHQAVQQRV